MTLLRTLARPLLASVFVVDGWDAMRHPERHAEKLEPIAKPLASASEKVPGLPRDTTTLARYSGAVSVAAGVMLATGRKPRLAAGVLTLIAVPMTMANLTRGGEREERRQARSTLLRNLGLVGGLIFAAGDRGGEPSRSWKRQYAKEHKAELAELKSNLKSEVKAAKAA